MAAVNSADPEYVKELEQQIQRIERENRRLKREVLTLSPSTSVSSKDSLTKSTGKSKILNGDGESYCLEDLEDIDLDAVLDDECEDSWIYKSPVRSTSNLTPEQWLLQGLDGGPVSKNRENLMDVRRDLSAMLSAEAATSSVTANIDDRSPSPSSLNSSGVSISSTSTYTVSPTKSYLHSNQVSPGGLSGSNDSSRGPSPSVSQDDLRHSVPSPQPVSAHAIPSRARARSPNAGSHLSPVSSNESLPGKGRTTSPSTGQRLARPPSSSTTGAGGRRISPSRAAPASQSAKHASGLRQPAAGAAKPRTGPAAASSTTSRLPGASGISRPAGTARAGVSHAAGAPQPAGITGPQQRATKPSGLQQPSTKPSGLKQPSARPSGLQQPRKSGIPASTATARGQKTWKDGCY